MAVSGTISMTTFNTRKVIDQGYGSCRLPKQSITGEMIETAKDQLFLMLSGWLNIGVPLWCQTKYILGFQQGVYSLELPLGVIDVLDANLRDITRLQGDPTSSTGTAANAFDDDLATVCTLTGVVDQNIALGLDETAQVLTTGILPGTSGTLAYTLQYSIDDAATWVTYQSGSATVVDSEWLWVDSQGVPLECTDVRLVVATASLPFSVRELVFSNKINEINMARINRDDYFYLPDKNVQGRPVQYWLDRQRTNCVMNVWPAPDAASIYRQMSMLATRHIMDVGTLQQEVEVPQRWYEAVVWNLAQRLAIITPEVKLDMIKITAGMAQTALAQAWAEERDRSPVNINIDISPYTA